MRELILSKLKEIEKQYGVRILLAVESGSRAWGFESPDSDYDVRFIYVRKQSDYLRLEGIRDVIELPIDDTLDINGWDIAKTLRLLYRLLNIKMNTPEIKMIPRVDAINKYLDESIDEISSLIATLDEVSDKSWEALNSLFLSTITE